MSISSEHLIPNRSLWGLKSGGGTASSHHSLHAVLILTEVSYIDHYSSTERGRRKRLERGGESEEMEGRIVGSWKVIRDNYMNLTTMDEPSCNMVRRLEQLTTIDSLNKYRLMQTSQLNGVIIVLN